MLEQKEGCERGLARYYLIWSHQQERYQLESKGTCPEPHSGHQDAGLLGQFLSNTFPRLSEESEVMMEILVAIFSGELELSAQSLREDLKVGNIDTGARNWLSKPQ